MTLTESVPARYLPVPAGATPAIYTPPTQNPLTVYLRSLSQGPSRTTMLSAARTLLSTLSGDEILDPLTFPWHNLRYAETSAVRAALVGRGYSPASCNKSLACLRGILRAAWRLELIDADDYARAVDVPAVKGERLPAGRALGGGELRVLVECCLADRHRTTGVRDAAILAVAYSGGLRRAEIAALDVDDWDSATEALAVRTGKGNKARVTYLTNGAARTLQTWLTLRGDQPGPMFRAINKGGRIVGERMSGPALLAMLRRRSQQAGVAACSVHDFRRTFIGDLLEAGADISTVQKLAGHASVTTTQRYDRRPETTKHQAAGLLHFPDLCDAATTLDES